ncbi:hypothetical protein BU17DRAFT_93023 [Hysterangium stoloniferum]|nr:hypothetical protein BU17DRAFT_93023 [Hysterangium stoloniferum]
MVPTSIPPHVVHTVFQYILPPNLPLPQHLLSKPLSQRHHFLSISHIDPAAYLCWPSSDNTEIVNVLQGTTTDALTWEPQHEVRYTIPDQDTALAHVRPNPQSPLQVLFAWDTQSETWRYHDIQMLPFPVAANLSLDQLLASKMNLMAGSRSASPYSDNDNYWEGYASSDTSQNALGRRPDIVADEHKAEAAYWASYAVVHGSGDSTVPSPRAEKKTFTHDDVPLPSARGPDTAFDPFVANLHLRLQQKDDFANPRYSHSDRSYSPPPVNELPQERSPPQGDPGEAFPDVARLMMIGQSGLDMMCNSKSCAMLAQESSVTKGDDRAQDSKGLKEVVRGLYSMWKTQTGLSDPEQFMSIVKEALE